MCDRPPIPLPMKRAVRQRCGFGCVICGCPIFEYDHIRPFSEEKEHNQDNLVLLCPTHHTEKTKGLITFDKVVEYSRLPVNVIQSASPPHQLRFNGNQCIIQIGMNISKNHLSMLNDSFHAIAIMNESLLSFRFEQQALLLSMILKNEEDEIIFLIDDSEMIFSTKQWDIDFVGRVLTIRKEIGQILLQIEFRPPNRVLVRRANFWNKGHNIDIKGPEMAFNKLPVLVAGNKMHDARYGIILNSNEVREVSMYSFTI